MKCMMLAVGLGVAGLVSSFGSERGPAGTATFLAYCPGEADLVIQRRGEEFLRFGTAAWGPDWAWTGVEGTSRAEAGVASGTFNVRVGKIPLRLTFRAERPAPNRLMLHYALQGEQAADVTLVVAELQPGKRWEGHDVMLEEDGKQSAIRVPFGKRSLGERIRWLRFPDTDAGETVVRFDPPCEIAADGALRLVLAKGHVEAGAVRRLAVTVDLPGTTDWYAGVADMPEEPGTGDWYAWEARGELAGSVLGMADWLDAPAGRHGRITREGSRLVYQGQPIKLWGLNLCYGACAPEKAMADRRAAFYPHYGINTVRLHKFADGTGWSGIQSKDSAAEFEPVGLDRMDYQVAKFKEAGIYVKLSAQFGTLKMGPGDRRDVPFLEEFGSFEGGKERVTAPHSAFFYSRALQDLQIRQMVNLLRHRNPHTGLNYAEDPAVCALEIINEQSVFFYTSMAPLKASATLRREVGARFSAWLRGQYGDHAGLLRAWGDRSLDGFEKDGFPAGEHLDRANVLPLGNPWYWDPVQLEGSQAFRKRRMLDTLRFLYELQCEAYDRYVAAVRDAGYGGEVLGSNWQAGRAYSHFANLHSDARVGLIDRHNYFGGGGGRGKFNAGSMLERAGSGMISSGLQQVEDRPFMLSEWIHVFPNEWGVEGPAILGAYGMGLQGWDVSYLFQNGDNAAFSRQLGGQAWDVMAPQVLGVFPAVSRQVLRGDVREADAVAVRAVHVPSLFEGRLGFEERLRQGHDDKELDGEHVPARALAVTRCVVKFTDTWQETKRFDVKPYERDGFLESATGQLRWKEVMGRGPSGYFTINTEGTKAVVGYAPDQPCPLDGVTLTPHSPFAAIYVTAAGKGETLATARTLIVVALARARNTGMKFGPAGDDLLEKGKGPVLMEPVRATIAITGRRVEAVQVLDHDGRPTDRTRPVRGGEFAIDGVVDRTPYYLVRCN